MFLGYLELFPAPALKFFPKKNYIFSQKNPNFLETENPEKFLILQETELSYTSGNATFLYFTKDIFRNLVYLELEAYSETWYI